MANENGSISVASLGILPSQEVSLHGDHALGGYQSQVALDRKMPTLTPYGSIVQSLEAGFTKEHGHPPTLEDRQLLREQAFELTPEQFLPPRE